jgi:hypothetical protein
MEDLMFVTGHVKTSAWATWATREISGTHSFSCTGAASCVGVGIQHSSSHTISESPAHACGPNPPTQIIRASPHPSPQTAIRSLESTIALQHVTPLAELRETLHTSHRVPSELSSIVPNQCLLVEGFRMRQRFLSHWRARKGEVVPADTSGVLQSRDSGSTQLNSSMTGASFTGSTNQGHGENLGDSSSNERAHVGNDAANVPLEPAIEVSTIGDEDSASTVVCVTCYPDIAHLAD